MNSSQRMGLIATGLVVGLLAVIWLLNRGYGEVGAPAYQYAKALYSTCNQHDEHRLDTISQMLASAHAKDEITGTELRWLEAIVSQARRGDWDAAGERVRRLMEDQVQ